MLFSGYELICVNSCADWVQARTHKKKRINKKWRKRYGMKTVPWNRYFLDTANMKIYGHPTMIEKLIQGIKAQQPAEGDA